MVIGGHQLRSQLLKKHNNIIHNYDNNNHNQSCRCKHASPTGLAATTRLASSKSKTGDGN